MGNQPHLEPDPIPVQVTAHHMAMTDPLREYAVSKMQRLNRYLDRLSEVEVILSTEHTRESAGRNVAEGIAIAQGRSIRAECAAPDMYAAIDGLVDKLHHQLTRTKERSRDHKRHSRGNETADAILSADDLEVGEMDERPASELIVETRQLSLKPLFPEEAIEEMNELGQTFFVFQNARTEKVSVVYRRNDGQYGLIEPAFA